jgi:hypothetical protein
MNPPIDLIQRRIANISVGPSTVRGKGREGTKAIVTKYLGESINLKDFSNADSESFQKRLDDYTEELENKIPSHEWGLARKVLNIFLLEAAHNIFLNKNYNLDKIISYLEVPLDNPNAKKLKNYAKSDGIDLEWTNIYSLDPKSSMQFQRYARQYASREHNCERCYLDLYWWRGKNESSQ